jgi:hypothetical protein
MNMEYKQLCASESYCSIGGFGLKILVAADNLPNLDQDTIRHAVYEAGDKILSEIKAIIKQNDPETANEIKENRNIVKLFPEPVFVEEIPNVYCSSWCCRHLPWFVVTTLVGRIKIGWRKRVINIDWSETVGTESSDDLFADEDVTKGNKYIHAWSIEKARQYIETIITSGQ